MHKLSTMYVGLYTLCINVLRNIFKGERRKDGKIIYLKCCMLTVKYYEYTAIWVFYIYKYKEYVRFIRCTDYKVFFIASL